MSETIYLFNKLIEGTTKTIDATTSCIRRILEQDLNPVLFNVYTGSNYVLHDRYKETGLSQGEAKGLFFPFSATEDLILVSPSFVKVHYEVMIIISSSGNYILMPDSYLAAATIWYDNLTSEDKSRDRLPYIIEEDYVVGTTSLYTLCNVGKVENLRRDYFDSLEEVQETHDLEDLDSFSYVRVLNKYFKVTGYEKYSLPKHRFFSPMLRLGLENDKSIVMRKDQTLAFKSGDDVLIHCGELSFCLTNNIEEKETPLSYDSDVAGELLQLIDINSPMMLQHKGTNFRIVSGTCVILKDGDSEDNSADFLRFTPVSFDDPLFLGGVSNEVDNFFHLYLPLAGLTMYENPDNTIKLVNHDHNIFSLSKEMQPPVYGKDLLISDNQLTPVTDLLQIQTNLKHYLEFQGNLVEVKISFSKSLKKVLIKGNHIKMEILSKNVLKDGFILLSGYNFFLYSETEKASSTKELNLF